MSYPWPRFASAKSSLVIDKLSKSDFTSDAKLRQTVDSLQFSQSIQLSSSDKRLMAVVSALICENQCFGYYLVKRLPVCSLIHPMLVNANVRSGELYAISVNTAIDLDDCLALLPNGRLVLSLKDKTYYRLGITGRKSILHRKKSAVDKHIVEIDVNSDHMRPTTKHYQRIHECLQRSALVFDVLIKWRSSDERSDRSISKFFDYLKSSGDSDCSSIQTYRCAPNIRSFTNTCVPIPTLTDSSSQFDEIKEMIEWFGAQVCQIDCNPCEDIEVSRFGFENTDTNADIHCVELTGFFTPSNIWTLITKLNDLFAEDINCVIVNGFEDTPISWNGTNNEHSKSLSGENGFGLALVRNHCFIWRFADEYDFAIERL